MTKKTRRKVKKKKPKCYNLENHSKVVDTSWYLTVPVRTRELPITNRLLTSLLYFIQYEYSKKDNAITNHLIDIIKQNYLPQKDVVMIKYGIPKMRSCVMCHNIGNISCRCSLVQYCSKKCKNLHWRVHNKSCQEFFVDVRRIFGTIYKDCYTKSMCKEDVCLQRRFNFIKQKVCSNVFYTNCLEKISDIENVLGKKDIRDIFRDFSENLQSIKLIYNHLIQSYSISILYISSNEGVVRFIIEGGGNKQNTCDYCQFDHECDDRKICLHLKNTCKDVLCNNLKKLKIQDCSNQFSFYYYHRNKTLFKDSNKHIKQKFVGYNCLIEKSFFQNKNKMGVVQLSEEYIKQIKNLMF